MMDICLLRLIYNSFPNNFSQLCSLNPSTSCSWGYVGLKYLKASCGLSDKVEEDRQQAQKIWNRKHKKVRLVPKVSLVH